MVNHVVIGLALIVSATLVVGNVLVNWIFRSDTKRVGYRDLIAQANSYRAREADAKLRQALAILDRDATYFNAKAATSLILCLLTSALVALLATLLTSVVVGAILFFLGALISVPFSSILAKATIEDTAAKEREAFRSVLAMYLLVFAVELRTHPVEIALREMEAVTASPVAIRITREIQDRIDRGVKSAEADGVIEDASLAQAICNLGKDWGIPELELIGETMRGSLFSPDALSDMILQQARNMKQSLMRSYAKKLEAQRPKLALFALLQIIPLLVFIMVPMLSAFAKGAL
jgi:hypothetical protein